MYSRCGNFAKAHQMLEELCIEDVVGWSALIAGYAQQGHGQDALNCYDKMQMEGVFPNAVTFIFALKACGIIRAEGRGKQIHEEIAKHGILEGDLMLGNALVNMYAKCGALSKARQVLEELPARNIVSWSTLIIGYAQYGQGHNALKCFRQMQEEGLTPNDVTFICLLKACASMGAADKGQEIHFEIARHGLLGKSIVLGNALVDMYAKCGALSKAERVLEELPTRDVVSWSALICGYAEHGQGEDALNCFEKMRCEGVPPNIVTFICILKACGTTSSIHKGEQIHDEIARQGLLEKDSTLGNALVDMYAKCGALAKARGVLNELPVRDVVSWSALIAGYVQRGQGEDALDCLNSMQREGLSPDYVTFAFVLKACSSIGDIKKGEEIHDEIVRKGLLKKDVTLGNALVDMYAKCGALAKAKQVLKELPVRDVVSWSALIAGYADKGQGQDALDCLEQMQSEGLSPNSITYISILKACGSIRAVDKGEQIHAEIATKGLLKDNIKLGNALVDMYAKSGAIAKAQEIMEELSICDAISWSAIITGYVQRGQGEEGLRCFERMLCKGSPPDEVIFVCVLKACASMGAADKGKRIHDEINRQGLLGKDLVLGNALVDMYAKCGALAKAQQILDELPVEDVVSWSALITAYAQEGQYSNALSCFEQMLLRGILPDRVAFSCVLNACSHSGLVDEGQMYFTSMSPEHGVPPDLEHFTCMVDLFGRAGHLDKAISMIQKMPSTNYPAAWSALLGACQKCGDVIAGKFAFDHAVCVDKKDPATYVAMINMYTAAGMHEESRSIQALQMKNTA
ncbi:hypothetical protein GOP47_0023271 [Adiantum capillus-veneris]|uniref:Pentatricopeptide repeat-containing protein n=1 Tax=Adiantum capillus-veneris TaxID=13818 RepID=A0A9D4U7F3_ADICA|nr:hypothetical protein GOP47_0023271 [Adiantum capillus-veneris]